MIDHHIFVYRIRIYDAETMILFLSRTNDTERPAHDLVVEPFCLDCEEKKTTASPPATTCRPDPSTTATSGKLGSPRAAGIRP